MSLFDDRQVFFGSLDGYPDLWLDHIAYCVPNPVELFSLLKSGLGADWGLWELNGEFGGVQVVFANGLKLEVIHPNTQSENHFTNLFIARKGVGVHHLTYRVRDINTVISRALELAIPLIQISLENPLWREVFIHPKVACGILVQIAECPVAKWTEPEPEWKGLAYSLQRDLIRIEHLVTDRAATERIFIDLLGGGLTQQLEDGSFELTWNEKRTIRFIPTLALAAGHQAIVVSGEYDAEVVELFNLKFGSQLKMEE